MEPPSYPWTMGEQPQQNGEAAYSALTVEVEVCFDELKQVHSSHKLQGNGDHKIAMSWPGGGQEHIGFALLVEATKREAIFDMLINMSNKPGFLAELESLSDEDRDDRLAEMSLVLMKTMGTVVQKIARNAVDQAYGMVQKG